MSRQNLKRGDIVKAFGKGALCYKRQRPKSKGGKGAAKKGEGLSESNPCPCKAETPGSVDERTGGGVNRKNLCLSGQTGGDGVYL